MPSETGDARVRVGQNALAQVVADVGGRGAGAVLQILLARHLGSEIFGEFSYALAIVFVVGIFSDLGLGTLVTREVARRPGDLRAILSRALWTRAALALLLGCAVALVHLAAGIPPRTLSLLLILAAAQIAQGQGEILTASLRGRERMVAPARAGLVCRLGLLACGWAALRLDAGPVTLAVLFAGWALAFPLALARDALAGRIPAPPPARDARDFLRRAAPIGIGAALWALSFRFDLLAVGWFHDEDAVGRFAAPFRLVEAVLLFSGPLLGAIFPLLARRSGDNALRTAARLLLAIGAPVAAVLAVEGREIVPALFGPWSLSSHEATIPLAFAIPLSFMSAPLLTLLVARDRERTYAVIMGVSLLAHAALAVTLIPAMEIRGAGVSFLNTEALVLLLAALAARREAGTRGLVGDATKTLASAAILGGLLCLSRRAGVPPPLGIAGALLIVWPALAFAAGAIRVNDLRWILESIRGRPDDPRGD